MHRRSIQILTLSLGLASLLLFSSTSLASVNIDIGSPPSLTLFLEPPRNMWADVVVYKRALPVETHIDPAKMVVVAQLVDQELPPARRYLIAPRRE